MKVAILYICTGKYKVFWKDFYLSSEQFFLREAEKMYFVFTDTDTLEYDHDEHVKKIYQKNLGWPGNTLFRYKIFGKYATELAAYDYVFFLNANMVFKEVVDIEILPRNCLLVVQHPGQYRKNNRQFSYERNPESSACIPEGEGAAYVCGGFNGGPGPIFARMICDLSHNIDVDYKKGIVAKWHDESHINRYILDHAYKMLDPGYAYPEGWWRLPFDCKVMIRDKAKYGGHAFLRQGSAGCVDRLVYFIKRFIRPLIKH